MGAFPIDSSRGVFGAKMNSPFFELARVLVRFKHVARFIDWLDDTRDKHSDAKHVVIAYDHADNARATKPHRVRITRT